MLGKIDSPLDKMLDNVEWGEFRLGDLFEIDSTLSFNTDRLVTGDEYDYVTRTSQNQGVLQQTGFINKENINKSGGWSLGLLQMDFFYRHKPWYAGQFVRKITPKIHIPEKAIHFITVLLNMQKKTLLSVLVRNVDKIFCDLMVKFPIKNANIDFDFMESFITKLEAERLAELKAYLVATGLNDYTLTDEEQQALDNYESIVWGEFKYQNIFNMILQGRRLTKDDQIPGAIPFVMAGVTNTGVVNYISNPVASFPKNSITIDIFGNTFYRNYNFGAGDDTGVYWSDSKKYTSNEMLFFTTAMSKSLEGKFSYGKKLRSSQSYDFKMSLPTKNGQPDYETMETLISAIHKLVIKDVVKYTENKL